LSLFSASFFSPLSDINTRHWTACARLSVPECVSLSCRERARETRSGPQTAPKVAPVCIMWRRERSTFGRRARLSLRDSDGSPLEPLALWGLLCASRLLPGPLGATPVHLSDWRAEQCSSGAECRPLGSPADLCGPQTSSVRVPNASRFPMVPNGAQWLPRIQLNGMTIRSFGIHERAHRERECTCPEGVHVEQRALFVLFS